MSNKCKGVDHVNGYILCNNGEPCYCHGTGESEASEQASVVLSEDEKDGIETMFDSEMTSESLLEFTETIIANRLASQATALKKAVIKAIPAIIIPDENEPDRDSEYRQGYAEAIAEFTKSVEKAFKETT
jgi:hypothetical protein